MERLQKVLAHAGIASRRNAEAFILDGRVTVNGEVVTELGTKVNPDDEIRVDGKLIKEENHVYYMLYKPKNTICAVEDHRNRKTVLECLPEMEERIYPVGRLDYPTTGLLLLTNDGSFNYQMTHPKYQIPKTYTVVIEGYFTDDMARILANGIEINGRKTLPAIVEIVSRSKKKNSSTLNITIFEGRNHEVRNMMKYFHFPVESLCRIQYGCLELGKLQPGQYRKLRSYEVKKLLKMANQESSTSIPKEDK